MKRYFLVLSALFLIHVFFMFFNLEKWNVFGWDQIDNAWSAARIILAHKYPLLGMVAKGNSGIYIGPLYYYVVAVFYFFTGLNPIASPILAGVTSLLSFWIIYYVAKELFKKNVAIVSCFIYTFSSSIILSERNQWPVNFIAPLSLLIFYFLYKVLRGEVKYFVHLAIVTGLSFHTHFSSVFYPISILLALPFIKWDKTTWRYLIIATCIGIFMLSPQLVYYLTANHTKQLTDYSVYITTYYHGFHLRRMLQLSHDAFIRFESILAEVHPMLRNAVFFYIPAFYLATLTEKSRKYKFKLWYLIAIWVFVPWIAFSTYSGEISDYYFNGQLYLAVIIFAYLTAWIWNRRYLLLRIAVLAFWTYYTWANVGAFSKINKSDFLKDSKAAQNAVLEKKRIEFGEGDPKSYLYFYYMYKSGQPLPYQM